MKLRSTDRLNKSLEELRKINSQAHALLSQLNSESFNRTPPKGGWSPGQCLEHLTNTNRLYVKVISRAIESAENNGLRGDAPFKHGLFERFFIWSMEPPPKFKVPAPKPIATVHSDLDVADITARYFATHEDIAKLMERARGLDLKQVEVVSPFSGKMKFNMAAAIDAMMAHERRHLLQAERAAKATI